MEYYVNEGKMAPNMHIGHMFGSSHDITPRACKAMDEEESTQRKTFVGTKRMLSPPPKKSKKTNKQNKT